jgi:M6 family metalloprotease-like protein
MSAPKPRLFPNLLLAVSTALLGACDVPPPEGDQSAPDPLAEVETSTGSLVAADFTKPFASLKAESGSRTMVVICMDVVNGASMPALSTVQSVAQRSAQWFAENSRSKLTIPTIRYFGCGGSTGTYRVQNGGYAQALAAADASLNFASFDTNRDRYLQGREVALVILRSQPNGWEDRGFMRSTGTTVDGLTGADVLDYWYSSTQGTIARKAGLVAHEAAHGLIGAGDMYDNNMGSPNLPYDADNYSMMDVDSTSAHLDPFHKLKTGWLSFTASELKTMSFSLTPTATSNSARILYGSRGVKEYFIVEQRAKTGFDSSLPDAGVLVWHIIEDATTAQTHSPPATWSGGWSRWAIRLETYVPLKTGDALVSLHNLRWANGEPSGFGVWVKSLSSTSASIDVVVRNDLNWNRFSHANGITAMTSWNNRLYATTIDNNLVTRAADPVDGVWTRIGHANGVVGLAAMDGKFFAATNDNKLHYRTISDSDQNWTTIGHANGIVDMTAVDGTLFAVTVDHNLVSRPPTLSDVNWTGLGDAPQPSALTSRTGRLFMTTVDGKLLTLAIGTKRWTDIGHAYGVRGLAIDRSRLYAATNDNGLHERASIPLP